MTPQPRQRPRRGLTTCTRSPRRTGRRRAHPHGPTDAPHDGHASTPEITCDSTTTGSTDTVSIAALRSSRGPPPSDQDNMLGASARSETRASCPTPDPAVILTPDDATPHLHPQLKRRLTLLRENVRWLRGSGAPDAILRDLIERADEELGPHSRVPVPDRLLAHGARVPATELALRVIHTPGHTPGHVCLFDEGRRLLLTGDHVLPGITPHVGVHPMSDDDPLGDFLASLRLLRNADAAICLPAHEEPFEDLDRRIDELVEHHRDRLDETAAVLVAGPLTTWQVAERLSWRRPWDQSGTTTQRAALAETLAHLVLLGRAGRARRSGSHPTRWSTASSIHVPA